MAEFESLLAISGSPIAGDFTTIQNAGCLSTRLAIHYSPDALSRLIAFKNMSNDPPWRNPDWVAHTQIMLDSFQHFVGHELITRSGQPVEDARIVFDAPFVVVSHGIQDDPILNYGNRTALSLWEMDVPIFTSTPSRLTAESLHRDERAALMSRAARDGFVDDYRGIRISRSGQRFLIEQAIIWNLINAQGEPMGQAATFSQWKPLTE